MQLIAKRLGVTEQDVVDMNRRLGGEVSLSSSIRGKRMGETGWSTRAPAGRRPFADNLTPCALVSLRSNQQTLVCIAASQLGERHITGTSAGWSK